MDREGFRNRLKQYKQAREENPGLKYWEFIINNTDQYGNVVSTEESPIYDEAYLKQQKQIQDNQRVVDQIKRKWNEFDYARTETDKRGAIPFIEDKKITLSNAGKDTGVTLSTNLLDSIAKYANKADLPLSDALGLAGQESTFGKGYNSEAKEILPSVLVSDWNYGNPTGRADRSENPYLGLWNTANRKVNGNQGFYNDNQEFIYDQNFINTLKGGIPFADKESDRLGTDMPVLEHAFKKFKSGKYNPKDPSHTKMVKERGKALMQSPQIQKWIKENNIKYAEGGEVTGPPTYEQWYNDVTKYNPTILDGASMYWSIEAAKKALHNEAMGLPGYATMWNNYVRSLPKADPDIEEFVDDLWVNENPNNVGYRNGKYYPHKSPEGGKMTIGPGFKLGSGQHKITEKQAKRGMAKSRLDQEARRVAKGYFKDVDAAINSGQTTNPADTVRPQIKAGLADILHQTGSLKKWPKLINAVREGDLEKIQNEAIVTWRDNNGVLHEDKRRNELRNKKNWYYAEGGEVESNKYRIVTKDSTLKPQMQSAIDWTNKWHEARKATGKFNDQYESTESYGNRPVVILPSNAGQAAGTFTGTSKSSLVRVNPDVVPQFGNSLESAVVHELGHETSIENAASKMSVDKAKSSAIVKKVAEITGSPEFYTTGQGSDYYNSAAEEYARLQQMRHAMGADPTKEYSLPELKGWLKQFSLPTDERGVKLMNDVAINTYTPDGILMAAEGTNNVQPDPFEMLMRTKTKVSGIPINDPPLENVFSPLDVVLGTAYKGWPVVNSVFKNYGPALGALVVGSDMQTNRNQPLLTKKLDPDVSEFYNDIVIPMNPNNEVYKQYFMKQFRNPDIEIHSSKSLPNNFAADFNPNTNKIRLKEDYLLSPMRQQLEVHEYGHLLDKYLPYDENTQQVLNNTLKVSKRPISKDSNTYRERQSTKREAEFKAYQNLKNAGKMKVKTSKAKTKKYQEYLMNATDEEILELLGADTAYKQDYLAGNIDINTLRQQMMYAPTIAAGLIIPEYLLKEDEDKKQWT